MMDDKNVRGESLVLREIFSSTLLTYVSVYYQLFLPANESSVTNKINFHVKHRIFSTRVPMFGTYDCLGLVYGANHTI